MTVTSDSGLTTGVSGDHFDSLLLLSFHRELYFWNVPQIQYMNPNVQIVRNLEMFPNPFIRCWLDDGKDVLFDCDSKTRHEILDQLIKVLGKSEEIKAMEKSISVEENPAIFGFQKKRWCMCSVPSQCPCPGVLRLPKNMQGKFVNFLKEDLEKEEREIIEGRAEPDYRVPVKYLLRQQREILNKNKSSDWIIITRNHQ